MPVNWHTTLFEDVHWSKFGVVKSGQNNIELLGIDCVLSGLSSERSFSYDVFANKSVHFTLKLAIYEQGAKRGRY